MDPAGISITVRVASTVVRPLIAKLFVRENRGAGLVDKPVRVSRLVSWRGEKRTLAEPDVRKLTTELVRRTISTDPRESAVADDEREAVADALARALLALGDIEMDDVQAVRLGHVELADHLHAAASDPARHLSADATIFYHGLLKLCCLHVLHFFTQRSTFIPHTLVIQTRTINEVLDRLDALVERIPHHDAQDAAFERRYLPYIAAKYGKLNIFGLDLSRPGRAQWPLDTAYLSLELATQRTSGHPLSAHRLRVERALSGRNRVLLRGLAGSGKTTLVQWLAMGAARGQFGEELAALRDRVPFVVPLRSLSGQAAPPRPEQFLAAVGNILHGAQPQGWADRVLHSGRGMLLIDGVDEVPEAKRLLTRRWLLDLVELYPRTFYLVTTRPSAVDTGWLLDGGFAEFDLLPLNRRDVNEFVDRWHDAALATTDQTEEQHGIEEYRSALHDTLRRKPDLYRLATNPLMCALICALHRDRHSQLPEGRMDVYSAALTMLLVRRDKEREVGAPEGLQPTEEAQIQLLQRLAYWLIRNGRSEATQTSAIRIIRERLPAVPQVAPPDAAKQVFRHLLLRSGLLREPSPDTVDFIHRTFQDYLGAKAAVEAEDLDLLAQHAGDDQWEDVIRMAIGHARERERAHLLRRLIQIGDQNGEARPTERRRYHLLAAACLEHATTLDPAVRAEVTGRASVLIPPKDTRDAQDLASAGTVVLELLPPAQGLTAAQAKATLTTIGHIGGEAALHELRAFKSFPDPGVRQQLALLWQYFDARAFAEEILADCPRDDLTVFVTSREQLTCLPILGTVTDICIPQPAAMLGLTDALAAVSVRSLSLGPLGPLRVYAQEFPDLERLTTLRWLKLESCRSLTTTAMLAGSRATDLLLGELPASFDLAPLAVAGQLRSLTLSSSEGVSLPSIPLPQVTSLELHTTLEVATVPTVTAAFPNLERLVLRLTRRPRRGPVDLSPLNGIPRVHVTLIDAGKVEGLEQLDPDHVTVVKDGRRASGVLRRFRP